MTTLFKTRTRRIAILTALIFLAASIIAARAVQTMPKVLRAKGSEFSSLDPQATGRNDQATLESALFRGLLRYDENGNPAPSIAREVPTFANGGISVDGKTYTFHLHDWNWSDGKGTVTADDFVYSFRRLVDPAFGSPYGSLLNGIIVNAAEIQAGNKPVTDLVVKAVDLKTLQVSLVKPVSYFNAIASMWITYAVRKDNVERAGLLKPQAWTDPANGEVVGSGPFRMVKWVHDNRMIFERNPYFSGTPARLDRVEFAIFEGVQVAYAAYQNDELEISTFPVTEYAAIKTDPLLSKELRQYTAACTNYLAMGNGYPPFDNKKVREAFTYALNRDLREKVIDKDVNVKMLSWLPAGVPGYDPNLGKDHDFNKERARQALAEAGYPDGKGFPKVTFSYASPEDDEANWYKAQFKDVLNIDIKLVPMSIPELTSAITDPQHRLAGLFEYGWCADYLHPSDWMYLVFGSDQPNNVAGYHNPEFDRLSKVADSESDSVRAMRLYRQVEELLLSDFPVIFFDMPRATKLVKPCVKNLKPSALDGGVIGGFFWEDIDVDGCKQ